MNTSELRWFVAMGMKTGAKVLFSNERQNDFFPTRNATVPRSITGDDGVYTVLCVFTQKTSAQIEAVIAFNRALGPSDELWDMLARIVEETADGC